MYPVYFQTCTGKVGRWGRSNRASPMSDPYQISSQVIFLIIHRSSQVFCIGMFVNYSVYRVRTYSTPLHIVLRKFDNGYSAYIQYSLKHRDAGNKDFYMILVYIIAGSA